MRLLALIPPGTNSRSLFCDLLRGAHLAGHQVFPEDICQFTAEYQRRARGGTPRSQAAAAEAGVLYARHLESLVRTLRIDAMVTLLVDPFMALPWVPRAGGGQTSFSETIGVPVVHYWLDAPFWAYGGQLLPALDRKRFASPWHIHVVNNEGTAEEMRTVLGFSTVHAAPYGVDTATFRPWPGVRCEYDVAICAGVGEPGPTAVMRDQLASEAPDVQLIRREEAGAALPALAELLDAALPGAGRSAASDLAGRWMSEQLSNPDRPMLAKFAAAAGAAGAAAGTVSTLTASPASPRLWAAATAIVRRADAWQRPFYASYISGRVRTLLIGAGAGAWEEVGWSIGGDRTGFVGYHELSVCYSRAAAGLNVMRFQDDIGLNPKGLEIAASGCVAVQQRRSGLDEQLVHGREGLASSSPAEALDQIRGLIADPGRCQRLAAAGCERVSRDHSWAFRASRLFDRVAASLHNLGSARATLAPIPAAAAA